MRNRFLLLLSLGCAALAQDQAWVDGAFLLFDRNADLHISEAELHAIHEEYATTLQEAVGDEEAFARLQSRYSPLIDLETFLIADVDDDRLVTRAELERHSWLDSYNEAPPPSRADCRYLAEIERRELFLPLLEDLDADGDGALSRAEAEEALRVSPERGFAEFDGNRDGKVEGDEFEAAMFQHLLIEYGVVEPPSPPE